MMFSDVPVGAKFKVKGFNAEYIKIHNGYFCKNCAELDKDEEQIMFFYFNQYLEVELVSKCSNCKYFVKHIKFCDKLGTGIELGDDESIDQDPETFSCSFFEMKD